MTAQWEPFCLLGDSSSGWPGHKFQCSYSCWGSAPCQHSLGTHQQNPDIVSGTRHLKMVHVICIVCYHLGGCSSIYVVYPRHPGHPCMQHCSPAYICTVIFAIPALVKGFLTSSPMLQHTCFFPKIWLKIRAVWL